MSQTLALTLSIAGIAVVVLLVAVWIASHRFFSALAVKHPELSFSRPRWDTSYGPIRPSKVSYLTQKKFLQLDDPELRRLGRVALALIYAYAVVFVLALIAVLGAKVLYGR